MVKAVWLGNDIVTLFIVIPIMIGALILALIKTDIQVLAKKTSSKIPVKWISGFMLFFAIFIGSFWIVKSLKFIFTKKIPMGITQTDNPTGVVFATDLPLLVLKKNRRTVLSSYYRKSRNTSFRFYYVFTL